MDRAKWAATLMAVSAGVALAWGQANLPLDIGRDLLTVREANRPDQKCRILNAWKQPDGTMAFEVQCLETEEHLTIAEMSPTEGGSSDPSRGMKSRIYHWGQSLTPPAGAPQMPAPPSHSQKEVKPTAVMPSTTEMISPTSSKPAPTTKPERTIRESEAPAGPSIEPSSPATENVAPKYALPDIPETKPEPIQIETAKPSNWHESWGKADDHSSRLPAEEPSIPAATAKPERTIRQGEVPAEPSSDHHALSAEPGSTPPTANAEPASFPDIPAVAETLPPPKDSLPDPSQNTEQAGAAQPPAWPPGYTYIDDRPGIADVTDMPPVGSARMTAESKKPVIDFLRALWKPSLKEPAPLQTVQINEMPVAPPVPDSHRLQMTLRDSLLPSQREMAAELLTGLDSQRDPTILPALLQAVHEDPAGTVRAACIHALAKIRVNTPEVVDALMSLDKDPDLRVRHEAHEALISLGLIKPEPDNEMIHQIRAP
jgi:hypothetical protein